MDRPDGASVREVRRAVPGRGKDVSARLHALAVRDSVGRWHLRETVSRRADPRGVDTPDTGVSQSVSRPMGHGADTPDTPVSQSVSHPIGDTPSGHALGTRSEACPGVEDRDTVFDLAPQDTRQPCEPWTCSACGETMQRDPPCDCGYVPLWAQEEQPTMKPITIPKPDPDDPRVREILDAPDWYFWSLFVPGQRSTLLGVRPLTDAEKHERLPGLLHDLVDCELRQRYPLGVGCES